jgi:hypothetical protein
LARVADFHPLLPLSPSSYPSPPFPSSFLILQTRPLFRYFPRIANFALFLTRPLCCHFTPRYSPLFVYFFFLPSRSPVSFLLGRSLTHPPRDTLRTVLGLPCGDGDGV